MVYREAAQDEATRARSQIIQLTGRLQEAGLL
jgi:hypothetical protein